MVVPVVFWADVAVPAIGVGFQQERSFAVPDSSHPVAQRAICLDDVIAKNPARSDAERGNPLADVVGGLALQLIGICCIPVVFTDKQNRELAGASIVDRLPEGAFVGGSFAKTGDADISATLQMQAIGRADCDAHRTA